MKKYSYFKINAFIDYILSLGWPPDQWRRQDLLQGGANMEILCHGALMGTSRPDAAAAR